jgi:outer membrane biosynthesis protein TonB
LGVLLQSVELHLDEFEGREKMGKIHDAQQALVNAGQPSEESAESDEETQGETDSAKAPPSAAAPKPKRVSPQRKPPVAKAKPAFKKRVKKAA